MNFIYLNERINKIGLIVALFAETLGNIFLLSLSGNFQSPYIWYGLNTVIMAVVGLESYMCWGDLAIYISLLGMTTIYDRLLHPVQTNTFFADMNITVGLIMATFAFQVIMKHVRKIEDKTDELLILNEKLSSANKKVEETMTYMCKIYEIIHLFSTQNNRQDLIQLILDYTTKMFKVNEVFFIEIGEDEKHYKFYGNKVDKIKTDLLINKAFAVWQGQDEPNNKWILEVEDQNFTCVPIGYTYKQFGLLLIEGIQDVEQLNSIIQLSGMLFKKFEVEAINEELLISEEQNRIANEIHDQVLQKLFGVTCNLFALAKKTYSLDKELIGEEINSNREILHKAMTELRQTIYGLSWDKEGKSSFETRVEEYIKEMQKLYHIPIQFQWTGELQWLTAKEQTSLYRIICEGISNGIRHGEATSIMIDLAIKETHIQLCIKDNGRGFDKTKVEQSHQMGLGLRNMQHLSRDLAGKMEIDSEEGKGTLLKVSIPNKV
ncbi:sensor histidine kinase [Sporanaerobium hydrogeniformans]|uniref:sensor histidine kinase n=1 Tax=Sporanaerobium hydrogeniformans TaxID=3072179 RepID=UPI0015D481FA|nr:sensor histidine kinase [Sporanaerobium hydrogeniformans]